MGRGRTGVPGALREPGLAPHGPRCSPLPRRPRPASCSGQGRHPGCSLRPAGRPAPAPLLPGDQGRHGGPRVVAPPQEVTSPHSRAAECLPGRPGARCPRSCGCRHGGRCDPHTGSCLCPAGWTGDECQSCEWDGLGAGARRPWGPAPGAGPRQGGQLSGAAGVPVRGPRPGRGAGERRPQPFPSCPVACAEGRFGADCEERCACRRGAACHHITGACLCPPGWRGSRCDSGEPPAPPAPGEPSRPALAPGSPGPCLPAACPPGWFGEACALRCQCPPDAACHHITGECRCPPGMTGPGCEQGK